MAVNEALLPVPRDTVWDLLADAFAYPRWVVGCDRTLVADSDWPAHGTTFDVRLAVGVTYVTRCTEVVPGERIVLESSGPLGAATVRIELADEGTGTRVRRTEDPAGITAPLRLLPPAHWAIRLRNHESLRRLRRLAEAHH
jgi:uncharacterized protein YndB with AHSA1/START domain